MKSLERKYNARLTEVFRAGQSIPGGVQDRQSRFTYSARAVDTGDVVKVSNVAPFRRWIAPQGPDEPIVICASVGDDCEIAMCAGQARLTSVPEQYLAGPCEETPSFA